jgi:pyridoxal phosphate enzyme (YggS family)
VIRVVAGDRARVLRVYFFPMSIVENVADVRRRISTAALTAGRNPDEITLMAVSKTFPADSIREAYAAGLRIYGENRVQEFAGKAGALRDLQEAEWHMIGHLQTNKAAAAAELFDAVDSLDSVKLAEKLNVSAGKLGKKLEVLIEINVGGETAKSGLAPDSSDLEDLLMAAPGLENLEFRGLMTIPPFTDDAQKRGPIFASCALCVTIWLHGACPRFAWTFCRWACRTILKLQLKKVRPACVWAQPSSDKGKGINHGGHGEARRPGFQAFLGVLCVLRGRSVCMLSIEKGPEALLSRSRSILAPGRTPSPASLEAR